MWGMGWWEGGRGGLGYSAHADTLSLGKKRSGTKALNLLRRF